MYGCGSCKNQNTDLCESCVIAKSNLIPSNWQTLEHEHKKDNVNHPSHYCTGAIEVIEYIEDKLPQEALQGYFVGNIIKYISRYKHKNGLEDLKKAAWYLDRMIKNMEKII